MKFMVVCANCEHEYANY